MAKKFRDLIAHWPEERLAEVRREADRLLAEIERKRLLKAQKRSRKQPAEATMEPGDEDAA